MRNVDFERPVHGVDWCDIARRRQNKLFTSEVRATTPDTKKHALVAHENQL